MSLSIFLDDTASQVLPSAPPAALPPAAAAAAARRGRPAVRVKQQRILRSGGLLEPCTGAEKGSTRGEETHGLTGYVSCQRSFRFSQLFVTLHEDHALVMFFIPFWVPNTLLFVRGLCIRSAIFGFGSCPFSLVTDSLRNCVCVFYL